MSSARSMPILPTVLLDPEAYVDMVLYARHSFVVVKHRGLSIPYVAEISGFAKTLFIPDMNAVRVYQPLILEQVNGAGGTDMHDEAIGAFNDFLAQPGVDPSEYLCWWHSHGRGGVYFSSRDRRTIEQDLSSAPYFVSIVVNVVGDVACRIDLYRPEHDWVSLKARISATEEEIEALANDPDRLARIRRDVEEKNRIVTPSTEDPYWDDFEKRDPND